MTLRAGLRDGLHAALQDCCAYLVAGEPDLLAALFTEDGSLEISPLGCCVSGSGVARALAKAMSWILTSEVILEDPARRDNWAGARGHLAAETTNGRLDLDFTIEIHLDVSGLVRRLWIDFDTDQRHAPELRG